MVVDEAIDEVERLRLDHELGVLGREALGHDARVRALVVLRVAREADRERLDAAARGAGHERHDRRRVEPAREEGAERHVGHEPPLDRGLEQRPEALLGLGVAHRLRDGVAARKARPPVALRRLGARLGRHQRVSRRQSADSAVERPRRRNVAVGQEERQRRGVALVRDLRVRQERLRLRGEGEEPRPVVVEERLLARAVAREQQAALARVPQREGEHAVELRDGSIALLLVEVQDHLAVALALEAVAALEAAPQLAEVVDLAVEDEPQRAVLVRHRLARGVGEVDDREPPMAEPDRAFEVNALAVRPAVRERPGHGAYHLGRGRPTPAQHAANAAHEARIATISLAMGASAAATAPERPGRVGLANGTHDTRRARRPVAVGVRQRRPAPDAGDHARVAHRCARGAGVGRTAWDVAADPDCPLARCRALAPGRRATRSATGAVAPLDRPGLSRRLAPGRTRSGRRPRPRAAPDLAPSRGHPALPGLRNRHLGAGARGGAFAARPPQAAPRHERDRRRRRRGRALRARGAARVHEQAVRDLERPHRRPLRPVREQEPLRRLRRAHGAARGRSRHRPRERGAPRPRLLELDRELARALRGRRVGRCGDPDARGAGLPLARRRGEPRRRAARIRRPAPLVAARLAAFSARPARDRRRRGGARGGARLRAAHRGSRPRPDAGGRDERAVRLLPAGRVA